MYTSDESPIKVLLWFSVLHTASCDMRRMAENYTDTRRRTLVGEAP